MFKHKKEVYRLVHGVDRQKAQIKSEITESSVYTMKHTERRE